uniref:Uncharacterized protein n=1 Tax=Oryza sativa subsp. indica TaxID=39946 RepID=C5NNN6_ORYSI|nr:hypothetical protein [Oryza sativa Indica Group]
MALLVLGPCDSDRRDGNHSSRLLPLTSSLSSVSAATATSRHCSSKANPRQPHPPNRTSPKGLHYCEPEYCHSGAVLLLQPSRVADCFIAGGHRDHHRVHKEKEHLGLPIVPVASRQNAVVVVFPKPPCLELVTGHLPSAFIDVLPLLPSVSATVLSSTVHHRSHAGHLIRTMLSVCPAWLLAWHPSIGFESSEPANRGQVDSSCLSIVNHLYELGSH